MPGKTKTTAAAARPLPSIPKELVDQFVGSPMSAQTVNELSFAFKKALIERALGAELSHHMGCAQGQAKPETATYHRNGSGAKTVLTEDGPVRIEVPRDRDGSSEPLLIPKHDRRFTGFDDKIVAMYGRGMTVREVTAWQARPLEPMYAEVFFDALRVKIRENAVVRNKSIYMAPGVPPSAPRSCA